MTTKLVEGKVLANSLLRYHKIRKDFNSYKDDTYLVDAKALLEDTRVFKAKLIEQHKGYCEVINQAVKYCDTRNIAINAEAYLFSTRSLVSALFPKKP